MKRYDLQDGDGVNIARAADLLLVMSGGRLTLPDFDVPMVPLEFHWQRAEPYTVHRDTRGFYVEVDDDTWEELHGKHPS
jgi:hypothetical protein